MAKGQALSRVMDDAAHRVLSGESGYDVANGAVADIARLDESDQSPASGSALSYWMEISDLMDSPWGSGSEELCDMMTKEFLSRWAMLADREDETLQAEFMSSFSQVFQKRLDESGTEH